MRPDWNYLWHIQQYDEVVRRERRFDEQHVDGEDFHEGPIHILGMDQDSCNILFCYREQHRFHRHHLQVQTNHLKIICKNHYVTITYNCYNKWHTKYVKIVVCGNSWCLFNWDWIEVSCESPFTICYGTIISFALDIILVQPFNRIDWFLSEKYLSYDFNYLSLF